MYGTVARMTAIPGSEESLQEMSNQIEQADFNGMVASYVYQMDSNPDEYYIAVIFESKEAYVANAESPEQNARYEKLRALLTADPEWHDGEIVSSRT